MQHPRASLLVTDTYGKSSRGPLGIYNFSGDLGKAIFPAAVALLLTVIAWRLVVGVMGFVGLAVAVALMVLVPRQPFNPRRSKILPQQQLAIAVASAYSS